MKRILIALYFFVGTITLFGKEGIWLPVLLDKYNISEMRQMGLKLSAQEIYDPNNASLKDAVVMFGNGCTGAIVSDEGLVFTNYHCGYRYIQAYSSVNNDYLRNGFWAETRNDELPNPNLTIRILEYMEDVTGKVKEGTDNIHVYSDIERKIAANIRTIENIASSGGIFEAVVKSLFYGNQYYLFVYKVFHDIRLVGAPPSSIGKFGGDTDNWMWPRHTGDFSVFRIYTGKNNEPAYYSKDNVPYKPKKYFSITLNGVQQDDFTMVYGFPGTTTEYIPSQGVELILEQRNPDRVKIRDQKLKIIGADMEKDPEVRIKYSAKYQSISNSWKRWQGEISGLKRNDALNRKLKSESDFKNWAQHQNKWENKFSNVFHDLERLYDDYADLIRPADYYLEILIRGVEIFNLAANFSRIVRGVENRKPEITAKEKSALIISTKSFFRDYNRTTDEKLFARLLPMLIEDLDPRYVPGEIAGRIKELGYSGLISDVYRKSRLTDMEKLIQLINSKKNVKIMKLKKDPVIKFYNSLITHYDTLIDPQVRKISEEIDRNMSIYLAGILEMKRNQPLYPDANATLRISYGKVEGYMPSDGIDYHYFTTQKGIIEKDNPEIYDYDVPEDLKKIFKEGNFGNYGTNGILPVCFLASNHTTGGNSGSPVINSEGQLIGLNFDRCWEGTMSDIIYDPGVCRNIILDIRYALFIIDRFAGAGHLLNELEIVP